jgi:uncharacterized protein (DUF2252 family)
MMERRKQALFQPYEVAPLEQRRAWGRALRESVPRSAHATWTPPTDRPDPIALLEGSDRTRVPHLVPIRYGRMLASSFAFFRGSAAIMACDLAQTLTTGLTVQLCGDAHLSNFGIYATPERQQVFDINDFDETLPGPWEWDIKRLVTSVLLAGKARGFASHVNEQAATHCVQSYHEQIWLCSAQHVLDMWYTSIDLARVLQTMQSSVQTYFNREIARAQRRTSLQAFPKLAMEVEGQYHIKNDPPLITPLLDQAVRDRMQNVFEHYKTSLTDDRLVLLQRYRLTDMAWKVVGVGSVGTRCFILLLMGGSPADPLFLQLKEAQASVLEQYLGKSRYTNHAQRVVNGQKVIQGASDIFLGWTSDGATDFYIRQLRDRSISLDIESMTESDFIAYVGLCGYVLARSHARSGDAGRISGYIGKGFVFDNAIVEFAGRYADQVEHDYQALLAAVESGRIIAEKNV